MSNQEDLAQRMDEALATVQEARRLVTTIRRQLRHTHNQWQTEAPTYRLARKARGISQTELASVIGSTQSQVSRFETGTTNPYDTPVGQRYLAVIAPWKASP
jgi:DNA-binding transcriptional regulator YiaG